MKNIIKAETKVLYRVCNGKEGRARYRGKEQYGTSLYRHVHQVGDADFLLCYEATKRGNAQFVFRDEM